MSKNLYKDLSEKRKELQEQGLVPSWYTTGGYQMFADKYEYDTNGKSVKGQFERIAATAAKHLKGTVFEAEAKDKFFELLWNGWLSPSTPVLANMGTARGMPVSCSGTVAEDSVDGFYSNLHEVAMLTKYGFGTATDLSSIRPRGSKISVGGKASGVMPIVKEHVSAMRNIAQGTARRGAWACYLDIEHGDFNELIDHLSADGDDLNIGWTIKQTFIDRLNKGDSEAVERFQKAMKVKMVTGKGYFFFIDKANEKRPAMYKDRGLFINNSQLCVAPETLVLTDEGYQQIVDLEDETVNVWNGKEFSSVVVKKTGENQKLVRVVTNSGFELECTPYHKFYVAMRNDVSGNRWIIEKRANELKKGDKLIKCDFPIIEGEDTLDFAYANGFYSADGCIEKAGQRIYLYHAKRKLENLFDDLGGKWYVQEDMNRQYKTTKLLKNKFFVPSGNYTIKSKLEWLAGFLDGDGVVCRNGPTQSIQAGSINKNFLLEIQMMLQTMGVSSKVMWAADEGMRSLPANDGTGLNKEYFCQNSWRIMFGQTGINNLQDLGFKTHRLVLSDHRPNRECNHFVKVMEVIDEGRIDDTYCFTEPKRGMGVFNGLLTGQCSEIILHNSKDLTYTCVLSSMNAAKFNEWKDTDAVYWATIFLDCVAGEFIERAKGIRGLEKAVKFTEKSRALGLGLCGIHTLFMQKMLPFESFDAHMLSQEISASIMEGASLATSEMAVELGEPEWCKGYGVRNTHLIAIAPTKSTALLMGGVSEGINPDPAMSYTQTTSAGEMDRTNPVLLELMKKKGVYTKKHIQEMTDNQGSVQKVDWLTDEEKQVFKTAFEINQKAVLRLASARSAYIDQWQSLNLFFSADESPNWIAEVHQEAFADPNILALYYVYTQAGVQASKGECEACQ
jgi:ribonucleoside-diphosphate reductase alpha chain